MTKLLRAYIMTSVCLCMQACFFDDATSGGGASFQNDISPLLITNCATAGCHDGDALAGGLNLSLAEGQTPTDQFTQIDNAGLIDTEMPDQSVLLLQAANADPNDSHGGGEVFAQGSDGYNQVLSWIEAGGINDDCTDVERSFAANVVPVLSSCTSSGCHDGTTSPNLLDDPYGAVVDNIDLTNPAQSRLLQNALGQNEHGGGTIFASVNVDDYRTIFCWIQEEEAADN